MAATREGAKRLKTALRAAMLEKGVESWQALALGSGVSETTIQNWIYARTVPRGAELRRVGTYLSPATNAGRLSAAYDAEDPGEDASTVQEALERHTVAVEAQNELLARLIDAVGAGALLVGQALGPQAEEQEARLRALEAARHLDPPADGERGERSAPPVRAG